MNTMNKGKLFSDDLLQKIRGKFLHVDNDPNHDGKRIFFDNAGGSFRLKAVHDVFTKIDALPDCPERVHETAILLQQIQEKGIEDIKLILNANDGSILTLMTASQAIFEVTRVIAENIPGNNIVTTALEHPSAYDAAKYYADKLGKEFRIAQPNLVTGGVDVEEIAKLIDDQTCLLSVIFASNISGAVLDIESIVKECRRIKPDLYIIVDAVQHAPHGVIDIQRAPIDAINIAPYKFFGIRGLGVAYVSDRAAILPHHKLLAKSEREWELGSPAPAHFAAISEIVNYVCWIGKQFTGSTHRREQYVEGMNRINLHERALMYHVLNGSDNVAGLRNMHGVRVFLDYEDLSTRDFIIAIGFDHIEYTQAVREYEKERVIVYERVATSLYSERILESLGMDGAVRISPLHCHGIEDIDKFLKITQKIIQMT